MNFHYHREAMEEANGAFEYYESKEQGLGTRFVQELQVAIDRLMFDPQSHAFVGPEIRSVPMKDFPYSVLYWIQNEEVEIIAVAHAKRRPGYWRNRISPD